jgi:glycosyltransferase involved in cell wall biosynthesis
MIPNFVDCGRFSPGDRVKERSNWGLPPDALVILCAAAIKKDHKRVDFLVRETERFMRNARQPSLLVVAGATERETPEVMALGADLLGDRVRFLRDVPRDRMPSLFRTADIFILPSLFEMMPIAVLEALASGLPVIGNATETLSWMIGPGGRATDISQPGSLAAVLDTFQAESVRFDLASKARQHVETTFAEGAVVPQLIDMYQRVSGGVSS